ncbi:hypothetical protein ACJRO7_017291 [Eucalyptus globulus]|uniref:Uncharacterized protein n=1 Tax=Eucalyptus globulus TaxID=34317 RepID=A0ABD3KU19_EUCGL
MCEHPATQRRAIYVRGSRGERWREPERWQEPFITEDGDAAVTLVAALVSVVCRSSQTPTHCQVQLIEAFPGHNTKEKPKGGYGFKSGERKATEPFFVPDPRSSPGNPHRHSESSSPSPQLGELPRFLAPL